MDPEQEKASRGNDKFSTLKNLAKVSKIFGTVLSVFAVVTFIIGLILVVLQLGFEADYTSSVFLKCLWILLALLFGTGFFLILSELVLCFTAIEENTRRSTHLLELLTLEKSIEDS